MARKRKSKPKGIKKGTATDNGKDTENDVPMNETLKTGADNVNEEREGHEVETTELNKERSRRRRKNTKLTEKTTSGQLNYAVDNAHEKEPEDEKQHDRAHAAMDTENEVPINETLKTGADNVNENPKGYEVKAAVLNKQRNTKRRNNKVTAKTPSDQLNNAVDNAHEKEPEDEKQHDRVHAVMDTENEVLKTGADNVNENPKGHEVKAAVLNKQRNTKRRNNKVTAKTPSDQLNNAVDNAHEKEPEDEKQHDRAHAAIDTENEVPINETLKIGADNVTEDREGYEVETTELNKKRNKRRKNSKVTAKIPSEQSNKAVDNGHEKKLEAEKQHDRAHAVVDKENESLINETLKTGADNVNGNGKGHEVETMQLKKKRNMEMTVKAPSDQLNYATDNGHEKKPEDEKQHDRTHAVMDTENESPINETLKTGAENVNEDGEGHEVETVELNTKRRNNKVTAKAPSDQLNFAMDSGHEKEPEAKKQNDRTHAGMNTENEAPTKETLKTGPVTDNKNREGMNEVETIQSNKKRNTEATAKAPLASDQLHYAAQQDKSQVKVKGQDTNKGLDEKIKEWREVLKMVEKDEEDSVYSLKTPPTKISSNGLHSGRGEMGEASLKVEFNAQSELLLVGQLLGLPLLADSAKRSLKYIQQVYMMQHGGRLESNILTEADIANSATQFLVDIQLMPFAPSLGDFLPPPDPNSYVLQTDDGIKKVIKQATAKKMKKKRKTFSGSNNGNCTSKSSLTSAETEEVVFVSKDVQETTSVEIIAINQDPQEVQTVKPCGSSSCLSPDENNVHVPDPSENLPVEENTKNTNENTLEVFEVPAHPSQKDKKRCCPLCDFKGFKLARHMKKHVKEGKIRENEISLWVKKADFKERAAENETKTAQCECENEKKGSTSKSFQKHERNHYLCRWQGCTAVVNRPSQHLKRVHALCDEMAAFARRSMKLVDKGLLQQAGTKRKASTSGSSGIQTTVSVEGLPPKRCTIREATGKAKKDPVRETGTKRRANAIRRESLKATPLKKRKVEEDYGEYSSETEDEESVQYADSTSSEEFNPARPSVKQNERMMEQIQMDLDDAQFVSGDESEDDDEGEVIAGKRKDQDWHDFYTDLVERSKTQRGKILAMFYDWLQHVEGGERKKIHSLQHVRQVHTILEVVEPNGDGLRPLTRDFGMAVWNEWAAPRLRTGKLSHGTVRNYILSLECFCQFLTTRRVAEKVDKFTIQRVQDLQTRLPKWRKTVHRRGAVEDTERFVKESEEALTPDDVKSLENSDHARQVIKNIAEMANDNPVSKKQFTEIRDYLLTTLILHNGARTGVVENCTVKQFQSAKKDTEGNYVVLVTNHKTTRTFGPVRLTFKPSLYSYTAMYVQEMLPIFANPNGVLFPSNKGKSFRQSNVGKRVSKTFQRANIRMDINVTATRLRKFHTGRVFYRGADAQELVADHMAHLTTTARKKYRRVDLMERSTAAFRIMQENIRGGPTTTKDEKMCADDADDKKGFELGEDGASRKAGGANCEDDGSNGEYEGPDGEPDGANDEGVNGNGKGDGASREPDGANGVTDSANGAGDGANGEAADKHKGSDDKDGILTTLSTDTGHSITITDDEKAVLKTLFKKEIRQGLKMSEQMIRDKLKTDKALKVILVSKAKVRNVQRWILREQKKTAAVSIANLPTMDAAEKTANYVATNGGQRKLASDKSSRQAWSMEDTKVIKRKFSELLAASETGSLTKSAIEAHWQKDDVLRAIYEREETFPGRTYIKVKTIFRWNSLV